MPNGGSDCCGTCWFNAKNKGEPGYSHRNDPEPDYCTIRNLPIENAFYTYCANHPHRNPSKVTIPVGPVFTGDSSGERQIWLNSPDTEEIRLALLDLLRQIPEQPTNEYPIGVYLDTVIIWQLSEFKEKRAIDELERIADFDPNLTNSFGRNRQRTIAAAKEALEKIEGTQQDLLDRGEK